MGIEQGSPENCETITENTPWGELGQGTRRHLPEKDSQFQDAAKPTQVLPR